ncbi:MAG: cache domain-containing protein [Proteobacteria bacterium]|nr:cache domain-containing protein [Pseudomonadota bacterium]
MMEKQQLVKMVLSFVLPPALVILLFTGAISFYIVPSTEDALMQKKKDTVRAIVVSATSILEKHAQMESAGLVSLEKAQELALTEMRALRYGADNQEYVWITDQKPMMLMHPFYPEMEGTMLDKYADSRGDIFFNRSVAITRQNGEGYINYMWSKGRNVEEVVPKLSYVKLLKPWGWIVGSGIYLDDVQREIRAFTLQLLMISGLIGIVVLLLLLFVVHRGWKSETGRYLAEEELIRSRERYQALAHASDEMIILVIAGVVAGANRKACENLELKEGELIGRNFVDLIAGDSKQTTLLSMEAGGEATQIEVVFRGKSSDHRLMLSAEHATVHDRPAILYTGRSLRRPDQKETVPIIRYLLMQSGFGIVLLDSPQNGKIVFADQTAVSLLAGSGTQSLAGKSLNSLVREADWQRMLLQLTEDKRVDRVHITKKGRNTQKILAWATIVDEEMAAKGQVAMVILDDSLAETARQTVEDLLAAAISPERLLPGNNFLEKETLTSTEEQHFLQAATVVRVALKTGLHAEKATRIAARAIDNIFQAGVAQAVDTLGSPPCPFAFLVLGSIGRQEPTMNPDQDTAIIYKTGDGSDQREDYFRKFGVCVTAFAATAGLPPCDAGNSAENPDWCLSEAAWHRLFTTWINDSLPEDLLKVNIFFDLRTVAGDDAFARRLQQQIFKEVTARPIFLYYLAQSTLDFRLPSDLLGRLRAEGPGANSINIKGTMLHFVNFIRIYALQRGIAETNTIDRLKALAAGEYLPHDILQDTLNAWKFLLQIRFNNQIEAQEKNFSHQNIILLDELDSWNTTMLKMAAGHVSNLQRRLSKDFVQRI